MTKPRRARAKPDPADPPVEERDDDLLPVGLWMPRWMKERYKQIAKADLRTLPKQIIYELGQRLEDIDRASAEGNSAEAPREKD